MPDIGMFISNITDMLRKSGIMSTILIVGGAIYLAILFIVLIYYFFRFVYQKFSQSQR